MPGSLTRRSPWRRSDYIEDWQDGVGLELRRVLGVMHGDA